jgi:hypothetical protein
MDLQDLQDNKVILVPQGLKGPQEIQVLKVLQVPKVR